MSDMPIDVAPRVTRLLRWYPKSWRSRYGDEFTELLISELSEQPRSWRRTGDVMRSGLAARLSSAGLGGRALDPSDQVRASLAALGCALAGFLAFGTAMWSQLTIGWQWSPPDTTATTAAMVVMSCTMVLFVALAVLAALPLAWNAVTRLARRRGRGLLGPSALVVGGGALLIAGSRHFGNGWPGTGGHAWAHQGLVPGGVAAISWSSTLSVSSYWAHPGALSSFPAAEIAWMAVSPLALVGVVVGAAKALLRLELSPRTLRYEAQLSAAAALAMLVFLGACCAWVLDGGPGPRNLFHAGTIDVAGLVVMAGTLVVAARASSQARRAGVRIPAR
ncbi:MAG: hypothetical protein ABSC30_07485 [Acidimicrobiales bacterium]|jgi:hypothetical protein